jgi:hypothetical protein
VQRTAFDVLERVEEAGHLVLAEGNREFLDPAASGALGDDRFLPRVTLQRYRRARRTSLWTFPETCRFWIRRIR